ncbi:MAG: GIY-YIG nuclease family protein [Tepidisphaeraceae bacterium]
MRGRSESNVLSERERVEGLCRFRSHATSAQAFFVYILRCRDGSLYVGYTSDLRSRVDWHNEGFGARWTAARRPVTLVHSESFASESDAVRRERQLNRWSRAKKEALIGGRIETLMNFSRCRTLHGAPIASPSSHSISSPPASRLSASNSPAAPPQSSCRTSS